MPFTPSYDVPLGQRAYTLRGFLRHVLYITSISWGDVTLQGCGRNGLR